MLTEKKNGKKNSGIEFTRNPITLRNNNNTTYAVLHVFHPRNTKPFDLVRVELVVWIFHREHVVAKNKIKKDVLANRIRLRRRHWSYPPMFCRDEKFNSSVVLSRTCIISREVLDISRKETSENTDYRQRSKRIFATKKVRQKKRVRKYTTE